MPTTGGRQPELRAQVLDLIEHLDAAVGLAEVLLGRWDAVDTLTVNQLEKLGATFTKTQRLLAVAVPVYAAAKAKRNAQSVSGRLQTQLTVLARQNTIDANHIHNLEEQLRSLGAKPGSDRQGA